MMNLITPPLLALGCPSWLAWSALLVLAFFVGFGAGVIASEVDEVVEMQRNEMEGQ